MASPARLLVATDFSAGAACAADVAIGLAARWGARLDWIHVASEPSDALTPSGNALITVYVEHQRHVARDGLAELRARASERGVESQGHEVEGRPDVAIARLAESQRSDWVVVGAHGGSGIHSLLLGSVAEKVARSSPVSTLVVRPGPPLGEGGTIVFGDDLQSSEVREAAAEVARVLAMRLFVVHAIELAAVADATFSASPALLESSVSEATEHLEVLWKELEGEPERAVCLGGASGALCDAAHRRQAGLVVTGPSSRKGLERWMLGSVTEKTLRHAPCSVLILK